jgi:hypothetical protein
MNPAVPVEKENNVFPTPLSNVLRLTSALFSGAHTTAKQSSRPPEMTTPYFFVKSVVREWFRSHQLIITPALPTLRDKIVQTLHNASFIQSPPLVPPPVGLDPNIHGPFVYVRLQSLLGNQYGKNQILAVYANITYVLWHVMHMLLAVCMTMNRKRIPGPLVDVVWNHCETMFLRQFNSDWVLPGTMPGPAAEMSQKIYNPILSPTPSSRDNAKQQQQQQQQQQQ